MVNRCYLCEKDLETIDHMFIHCPFAREVWGRVLESFGTRWVFPENVENLIEEWRSPFKSSTLGKIWEGTLAQAVWGIWKERNRRVFEGQKRSSDIIWNFIQGATKERIAVEDWSEQCSKEEEEIRIAWGLGSKGPQVDPRKGVKWGAPLEGWIKLNFDGASKGNPGEAGGGGVLRNNKGEVLGAFEEYYGVVSNHQAELRAMWKGILILRNQGRDRVIIEGDSLNVIKMLRGEQVSDWRNRALIEDARKLIAMFQEAVIQHTYREGNKVADGLANRAVRMKQDREWKDDYPEEIKDLVILEKDS